MAPTTSDVSEELAKNHRRGAGSEKKPRSRQGKRVLTRGRRGSNPRPTTDGRWSWKLSSLAERRAPIQGPIAPPTPGCLINIKWGKRLARNSHILGKSSGVMHSRNAA